mmetsp:Transcript_145483/g.362772  ORF Transcript_145483/g.362772 Transcript_145483/m.362772 type:complete len:184 (+) Transcript_145483:131-682(+)|eukprot:CAMPEP_0115223548 /NCGR_PEP_ID=MMETSP0270-20121206/29107_1 /TAXON_ID=71861 /ORGANISM="Scrippsiella trochoidea, Strain CCMP3099" /LENGTH=183 /DNA_ID=CAMNT_0002637813 /DNA_START=138 /DNA_END=689 /DNA_ORIENTATION=-
MACQLAVLEQVSAAPFGQARVENTERLVEVTQVCVESCMSDARKASDVVVNVVKDDEALGADASKEVDKSHDEAATSTEAARMAALAPTTSRVELPGHSTIVVGHHERDPPLVLSSARDNEDIGDDESDECCSSSCSSMGQSGYDSPQPQRVLCSWIGLAHPNAKLMLGFLGGRDWDNDEQSD